MTRGWLPSLHQLRDELAHALVAPAEDRGVVVVVRLSGCSIMNCRLLMMAAVCRSPPPPAGMSGWCMCRAMAKQLRMRSNSMSLSGRKMGPVLALACASRDSEPQRSGRRSAISAKLMVILGWEYARACLTSALARSSTNDLGLRKSYRIPRAMLGHAIRR